MNRLIGVMQGRLSEPIKGQIQGFPSESWREEFPTAARLGLGEIEWLVKSWESSENPIWSRKGRQEIKRLSQEHGVSVRHLTADVFMAQPLANPEGKPNPVSVDGFKRLAQACREAGIDSFMIPFVDSGDFVTLAQKSETAVLLNKLGSSGEMDGLQVTFEMAEPVPAIQEFLRRLDPVFFGLTYDIGDRTGLGGDCAQEIVALDSSIAHVHIKDKLVKGPSVPLGMGEAPFPEIFDRLSRIHYKGVFILQHARGYDPVEDVRSCLKFLDRFLLEVSV